MNLVQHKLLEWTRARPCFSSLSVHVLKLLIPCPSRDPLSFSLHKATAVQPHPHPPEQLWIEIQFKPAPYLPLHGQHIARPSPPAVALVYSEPRQPYQKEPGVPRADLYLEQALEHARTQTLLGTQSNLNNCADHVFLVPLLLTPANRADRRVLDAEQGNLQESQEYYPYPSFASTELPDEQVYSQDGY